VIMRFEVKHSYRNRASLCVHIYGAITMLRNRASLCVHIYGAITMLGTELACVYIYMEL